MNLFLRLLIVLVKSRFQQPIGLFDACLTQFRVWLTDQDAFQHTTNSRYFSLTDVCIVDYMLRTRSWPILRRRGWLPYVTYEDMIFRKSMRWPHKFHVRTQMLGWTDEFVVLSHVFVRRDKVTAEGLTIARFVNRKGETIAPPIVADAVGHTAGTPELPGYALEALERASQGYWPDEDPAPSEPAAIG